MAQALQTGPVHIVEQGQPRYVVLTEQRYQDLLEAEDEAYLARVQASLADVEAGRVRHFDSVDELMQALETARRSGPNGIPTETVRTIGSA